MAPAAGFVAAALTVWIVAATVLSVIDLRTRRLPTKIIWPTAAAVWGLYSAASILLGSPAALLGGLAGAFACSAPMCLAHVVHPPSMGFGDVRFSVLNGLVAGWWGWRAALIGLALGFVAALPEALVVIVRHGPRTGRPLGPYLALGTCAAVVGAIAVSGLVPDG